MAFDLRAWQKHAEESRGWLYKVMPGLGEGCFKARYHKQERRMGK